MMQLRRWLESRLGIAPVAAGEDTQWHLRANLGWPDWLLFLFVVFAVVWVVSIYLREATSAGRSRRLFLAGVRLAIVALIVGMISGVELAIDRTGLPFLVLMVDDSESMRSRDSGPSAGATTPTRLEQAKEWLGRDNGRALLELLSKHKIQLHAVSTGPRLLATAVAPEDIPGLLAALGGLKGDGSASRLGGSLRTVLNQLRGTPPSSMVFVTDGVNTEGESLGSAAQYAARKNIPVFPVGIGEPGTTRDLDLRDLLVDNTVFVDDTVTFEAKLLGRGFDGEEVAVRLGRKNEPAALDIQKYKVPKDGAPLKIRLTHRPTEPGMVDYVLEVEPRPREIRKDNNRIERQITVLKEKIRVLYVESYPRYEFRFLKSLLEREATVELGVILLDADPEYVQQDRAAVGYFPTTKKDLFEQDVVILGDIAPSVFSQAQLELLRDFVRAKGGGLIFLSGRHFAPGSFRDSLLADLLPVVVGSAASRESAGPPVVPRWTLEGRASPMFRFQPDEQDNERVFKSLAPIPWFARVEKAKPGAQVLLEAPGEGRAPPVPLVASQFFGAGRTYYQGFDSTWRWRHRVEDRYFSRYWVQVVRFVSRSKLLGKNRAAELLVDRRSYRRGEPVQFRVRFLDEAQVPRGQDSVAITVEHPQQASRELALKPLPGHPEVFEGVFAPSRDGAYRARLTSPVVEGTPLPVEFAILPPPGELDHVEMNEAELKQLAEATGGEYFRVADADGLWSRLPAGRRVALHTDPPIPLWNTWPVLATFIGLLLVEWVMRKLSSMV